MSTPSKPKTVTEEKPIEKVNQITDISQLSPEVIAQIVAMIKPEQGGPATTNDETTLSGSEAVLAAEEKSMKARIMACPKEKIFVPKLTKDEDDRLPIAINGVIFSVKKDTMVDVPKPVADAYNYSKSETNKAMAKIKIQDITERNDLEIN